MKVNRDLKKLLLTIVVVILFGGLMFALGFAAGFLKFRPGQQTAEFTEAALSELRQALTLDNNIINCRSMVNAYGRLKISAKAGSWESILPAFKEEGLAALPSNPTNVIIFAHGYNSGLDGGIHFGNALCKEIRSASKTFQGSGPPQLVFYTFCWRGDFNEERFGTSEKSAETTAPSLANIISTIEDQAVKENKKVSITLLSHSLGAKVCLETLKVLWHRDKDRKWVKRLLMLQPAVTVGSMSKGTYDYVELRGRKPRPGELQVYPGQGQFRGVPVSVIRLPNDGDDIVPGDRPIASGVRG